MKRHRGDGIRDYELLFPRRCFKFDKVLETSRFLSRQYPNASLSFSRTRKLREGDLDPANVEIQRTWSQAVNTFRSGASTEWFSSIISSQVDTLSATRKLLSESTLHFVEKFSSILFIEYTLMSFVLRKLELFPSIPLACVKKYNLNVFLKTDKSSFALNRVIISRPNRRRNIRRKGTKAGRFCNS